TSDAAAVELLREGLGDSRQLNQIEIIDVKAEQQLRESWKPFIRLHKYHTNFARTSTTRGSPNIQGERARLTSVQSRALPAPLRVNGSNGRMFICPLSSVLELRPRIELPQ